MRYLAGITFITLSACSAWAGATEGKEIYAKRCRSCHGAEGQGNPSIAKMLNITLRPLGSKEVQDKSDAELKKDIVDGIGKMKPVTGLSAKEVDDTVAYVRTLKK